MYSIKAKAVTRAVAVIEPLLASQRARCALHRPELREHLERVAFSERDEPALDADDPFLHPRSQELVHALAAREDQLPEFALRETDPNACSLGRRQPVALGEREQFFCKTRRKGQERGVLGEIGESTQPPRQDD